MAGRAISSRGRAITMKYSKYEWWKMNVNAWREERDWIDGPSFIHVTEAVIPESHYNLALVEGFHIEVRHTEK